MRSKINTLYLVAFLLNLHVALPTYINSTFLSNFIPANLVGIAYTTGASFSIFGFLAVPKALERFGNFKVAMVTIVLEFFAVLVLALTRDPVFLFISFGLTLVLARIIGFNADIFLENLSSDGKTGGIRGFFLSASNTAWVISPIIAGFLLGNDDNYSRLYLVSALVIIPVLLIVLAKFRKFKDPHYDQIPFWGTLAIMMKRHNVRRILLSNLMLRFFYAWMVIYTPIYLREHMGFGWDQIGIIFTVMLLPFILFELPLGKIADKWIGEKELLSVGFVIIAASTIYLSFITEANLILWAGVLFLTRVGASMTEIMNETYFFKKIDSSDSNLLGFFRMTGPIAYIIAPIIATLILPFIEFRFIFLILGVFMLWGLRYSLTLKDTLGEFEQEYSSTEV